jgi:hypothetical protein
MKKILFLAFAVLLLLNCTDQNGLERASKNQLSKFLSSNASYKKFIDAHYKNTLLLASLDVNQSKRVEDLFEQHLPIAVNCIFCEVHQRRDFFC